MENRSQCMKTRDSAGFVMAAGGEGDFASCRSEDARRDGVRKSTEERIIRSRSSNRWNGKSGNRQGNRCGRGVQMGVSFRKSGCGIEGKWKGGFERVSWVPMLARFALRGDLGMWIYGSRRWKVTLWAGLMRVWRGRVLQGDSGFHGLHRGIGGIGKAGLLDEWALGSAGGKISKPTPQCQG